ncbi:TIGR03086 family metal-binding protein [Sporichthya brevicatena]|uniref:TIGR03086 family metal-binding protein n=1 Tax=Sporichthya brevicatena TaxID=171442 RepID=A0ABN1H2X1_9ACTN
MPETQPGPDLTAAATEVTRLLDGVREGHLAAPTPCAGLTVGALLEHFLGLTQAFTDAARKVPPPPDAPRGGAPTDVALNPEWRALLPQQLGELAQAWRDPAAWAGEATAGGVTMPAEVMGVVALDELVLHGWDLARATGQDFACDEASAGAVLGFTQLAAAPEFADSRDGLFGPVVEVPADAPPFVRALGLSGRDPAWTP